jgi:DNA-binding response OmpR family regulator
MTRPGPHANLLLVEDDERLAPLVLRHLRESGFETAWAKSAKDADTILEREPVDLAILDIMLPGEDGLSFCRRLRKSRDIGIVMVTARGEEADRIMGLGIGADDYLAKPFSLWELEARIKAVLRRYAKSVEPPVKTIGPFSIDLEQRRVSRDGQMIDLTRSEFDLLAVMIGQPGIVFSRERLLETLQGGESGAFDRAVDTHVSNLRRKLEHDPKAPQHIKTVWGVGYRFEA